MTSTGARWEQRGLRATELTVAFSTTEGVQVEQGLLGRILGYGTVHVLGRNVIGRRRKIARPVGFRQAFNNQMSTWLCRSLGPDPRRNKAAVG